MTQASASDRKDVRRAEKAAKLASDQNAAVVAELCSTAAGRRWVWELLASAHVFTSSIADTPERTAFNEGQRAIGLSVLAQISTACPEQFIQAMRESNERSSTDDARRESDRREPDYWDRPDGAESDRDGTNGTFF